MSKITPKTLDTRLSAESDIFVLDIRSAESFEQGSIAGSHNISVYSDLQRGDEAPLRERLNEIPEDHQVIVVCKAGIVARRAASVLVDEGYEAVTLLGGMSGWNGYQNDTVGYKLRSVLWKFTA